MTLTEWTDEIAKMTPRQKEAVGYAMGAVDHIAADREALSAKTGREYLEIELMRGSPDALSTLYPAAKV